MTNVHNNFIKKYIIDFELQNNNTIKLLEENGFPNAIVIYSNNNILPLVENKEINETIVYREILLNGLPYKESTLILDGEIEWTVYHLIENRENNGGDLYHLVLRTDDKNDYDLFLAEHYRLYEKTRNIKYLTKIGYDFYKLGDYDTAKNFFNMSRKYNCGATVTYLNFLYL